MTMHGDFLDQDADVTRDLRDDPEIVEDDDATARKNKEQHLLGVRNGLKGGRPNASRLKLDPAHPGRRSDLHLGPVHRRRVPPGLASPRRPRVPVDVGDVARARVGPA